VDLEVLENNMQNDFIKKEYKAKDSYEKLSAFYSGVGNAKRKKSIFLRTGLIIFCTVYLFLPGVFFLFASGAAYVEGGFVMMLIPLCIGLVMGAAGISGVWNNIFIKRK
jgi:hypothetical protein